MTKLKTKALGTVDVATEQILEFQEGIFGFPDNTSYALIEDRADSPFKWLQSIQEPDLAFIVIQPELFLGDKYLPDVAESELNSVKIDSVEEALVLVIVTIPQDHPEKMTANLQGPVIINREKKIGRQIISRNDQHSVRVPILEQLSE